MVKVKGYFILNGTLKIRIVGGNLSQRGVNLFFLPTAKLSKLFKRRIDVATLKEISQNHHFLRKIILLFLIWQARIII